MYKVIGAVTGISLALSGCDATVKAQMDAVYDQVSSNAIEQYNIAKEQGDPIQICVLAGMVAASYLQAKDQENYDSWRAVEISECEVVGM